MDKNKICVVERIGKGTETGINENEKGKTGQMVEKREGSPFVFTGSLGDETPKKSNKRQKDEEGEGVDRFTYGAGSIVDTVELRDYTCILGRRGRELSDELLRLIMTMKTEKASMTKAREEAFKKTRTGFMNVIDELVYAQMMIQGRLIEARHRSNHQTVSDRTPVMTGAARWGESLVSETTMGNFTTGGDAIERVIAEIQAEKEEEKKAGGSKEVEKVEKKKKKKRSEKKTSEGPVPSGKGETVAKASTSREGMVAADLPLEAEKTVAKPSKKPKKAAKPVPQEKGRKRVEIPVRPLLEQPKPITEEWTTVKRKVKRKSSQKRVVPDEVRMLLEETKKARENKHGGYVLSWSPKREEKSEEPKVTSEVTEAQMIKNLWDELAKKKCAPKFKRLKKVGKDRLYVEPENEETRKLLQNASLDIRRAGERNPHIMVHGVGIEVKDDEVAVLLEEQNESSVKLAAGWFKNLELISHKSRVTRKGRSVEFVVTPEVAGQIVGQTMCVGLSRCRVGPSVNVRRCHRCQRYGHTGVACKAPSVVCGRCAGAHHAAHCVARPGLIRCTSCAASGWACDHVSGDTAKCRTWEVNFRREARKFKWSV